MFIFLTEHVFFAFERVTGNHQCFVFRTKDEEGKPVRGTIRVPLNEHGEYGFEFSNETEPDWFAELCTKAGEKAEKAFRLPKLFK